MSYILIVDGYKKDRDFICDTIASMAAGINVRCVEDAFIARDLIAKEDPLLIILDVDLPRMSGESFLGISCGIIHCLC